MKIAYLLADPGIGIFGTKGASVHAQEMIRAFRAMGHEITVFCTKRGDAYGDPRSEAVPADLSDLAVFIVPVAGVKGAAAREGAIARASDRMAVLAAEGDYDLLYERYSLFSVAGAQAKRRTAAPLIVEVNAPLLAEQAAHRSLHDVQTAATTTKETFMQADLLSCVSPPVAHWVRSMTPQDGRATRVRVTPNGVDPARFSPRAPQVNTDSHSPVTIGFLGTLKPWHGTDLLLHAFARTVQHLESSPAAPTGNVIIPLSLRIIGGGPQRQALENLAAELGISERTEFTGPVPPEQVPAELAQLDIAAAPYPAPAEGTEHYFSPLKVYEYLAAGVPVVASELGELGDLLGPGALNHVESHGTESDEAESALSHEAAGALVPPGDIDALAAALMRLVADPQLRARVGSVGRSRIEARHSWNSRAQELLADLAQPLSNAAPMRRQLEVAHR